MRHRYLDESDGEMPCRRPSRGPGNIPSGAQPRRLRIYRKMAMPRSFGPCRGVSFPHEALCQARPRTKPRRAQSHAGASPSLLRKGEKEVQDKRSCGRLGAVWRMKRPFEGLSRASRGAPRWAACRNEEGRRCSKLTARRGKMPKLFRPGRQPAPAEPLREDADAIVTRPLVS
jgi:hypothetical protein